jgi:long-subunit acyl-CoA synthetase (AMP-forming)
MKKYAKIEKGKIAKFRRVHVDDKIIVPKLLAHGYLIVDETERPPFDPTTQARSFEHNIKSQKVKRVCIITERVLKESKARKIHEILTHMFEEIRALFYEIDNMTIKTLKNQDSTKIKINNIIDKYDLKIKEVEKVKNNHSLRKLVIP